MCILWWVNGFGCHVYIYFKIMFEFQFDQFYKWLSQKYNQKLWNLQIKNSQNKLPFTALQSKSIRYLLFGRCGERELFTIWLLFEILWWRFPPLCWLRFQPMFMLPPLVVPSRLSPGPMLPEVMLPLLFEFYVPPWIGIFWDFPLRTFAFVCFIC